MRSLLLAAIAAFAFGSADAATLTDVRHLANKMREEVRPNGWGLYMREVHSGQRIYVFVYDPGSCDDDCLGTDVLGIGPHEPYLLVVINDAGSPKVANRYEVKDAGLDGTVDWGEDKLDGRNDYESGISASGTYGAWQEMYDKAIAIGLKP